MLQRAIIMLMLSMIAHHGISQRVALVLSGGGSKGLVHVGVLQALEEYDIPIDYIVGSSMGAIVGGLYASGYSPDSIASMLTSDKFTRWASGVMEDRYTYYFKQKDPDASWVSIKFNYDDVTKKLSGRLPTNLVIPPYEMDFNLLELFAGASAAAGYNFNDLFIPFRCVASDIDFNRSVVLSEGQLGSAIRASMTFPFYYLPIELDGKLLFDGGMYNNFPSDVAMADFYPDVIIGSKAAGNYDSPGEDDLLSQLQNMLMTQTDYSLDSATGILLEHEMGSRAIFDFSHLDDVIDAGYQKTIDNITGIYDLIGRRVPSESLQLKRSSFRAKIPPLLIDSIHIEGLTRNQSGYVRKLFKHKEKQVGIETVKMQYFKLIADDMISSIFPELKYNTYTGYYDLHLKVKKSENFVGALGGNISSSTSNGAYVGLAYRYLGHQAMSLRTNLYLGRFYSSYLLSGRIDFPSRTPFFMELAYVFNSKNYFRNTTYFFDDKTPSFLISKESYGSFSAGVPATYRGKFVFGVNFGEKRDDYYQDNVFSREDTADITRFEMITPKLLFELNSLNRKQYASAGVRFLTELQYVYGKETHTPGSTSLQGNEIEKYHSWFRLKILYDNYFNSIGPVTLGFYGELMLSNQAFFSNYTSSILASPAFEPILESKTLFLPKYRAYNYGAVGIKFVIEVYRKIDLRVEGYLFQPYQEILSDENMQPVYGEEFSYRSAIASSSVVWRSPLGPLSVSLNYYDRSNDNLSLFFNFGYIIFNKSISD